MNGQNRSTPASPATALVDNVFRRALNVADTRSPEALAEALLRRYPDDAARIERERLGLPFSVFAARPVAMPQPGRAELTAASDGLDAALNQLTTDPDLADVAPELRGWAQTIRSAAADGMAASASAIDPAQLDRAFAARHRLGEYARLARYTGALSACSPDAYCRVARGCDDVANVILVQAGDALGYAGLTRSGAVIRVPAAQLRSRADAVFTALRNLLQPPTNGNGEDWPRGPVALRQLYDGLDAAGAPDLRALLDEQYLAQQLAYLVDGASASNAQSLRGVGSAAITTIQSLQRFLTIASGIIKPDSPPAVMFFAELQLFMQGFGGSNVGYRLPYLARSPLLVKAFAASAGIDGPTRTLLTIALSRTALADAIDCLCCLCDAADARDMVAAGKVLFELDRALDFYALGMDTTGRGKAEWRAAVQGAIIDAVIVRAAGGNPTDVIFTNATLKSQLSLMVSIVQQLQWPDILTNPNPPPPAAAPAITADELVAIIRTQIADELRWSELVSSIAPLCRRDLLFRGIGNNPTDPVATLLNSAIGSIGAQLGLANTQFQTDDPATPQVRGDVIMRGNYKPLDPTTQVFALPRPIASSLDEIAN